MHEARSYGKKVSRLRLRAVIATGVALVLALTACGSDDAADSDDNDDPEGGRVVIAVESLATEQWAVHLAASAEKVVTDLISEPLIRADPETLEPVPNLAESWELSDDHLSWTFKLREGVQFHDDWGELTADDVKFTFEQILRDDAVMPQVGLVGNMVSHDIETGFEIIDDYTFRVHTDGPLVGLIGRLTPPEDTITIYSRAQWGALGEEDATAAPAGTGPYKFVSHEPGVNVVLEAVKDHWRQPPAFDELEVRIIPEPAQRLSAVRTNEADLGQVPLTLLPEAEAAGVQVFSVEDAVVSSVLFGGHYHVPDPNYPDIDDPDAPWWQGDQPERGLAVRQALSMAIDRQSIVDDLLMGHGAEMLAPEAFPTNRDAGAVDPDWDYYEFDPERARELLAEGGYPDGFEVDYPIFELSGRPTSHAIAEAIASMWEEHLGIRVNRIPMDYSTFRANPENRTTQGMIWVMSRPFRTNPFDILCENMVPGGGLGWWYDPFVYDQCQLTGAEPDQEQVFLLAREMGTHLRENFAPLGIVSSSSPYVASDNIGDWPFTRGNGSLNNLEYLVPAQ